MHRRCMEKAEVDMIVILDFLKFGRAVVCDEGEVYQSFGGLGTYLGCVMDTVGMRRRVKCHIN